HLGGAVDATARPTCTAAAGGARVRGAPGSGALVPVIGEEPLCPALVAVIVADPAGPAVTRPLPSSATTVALLLPQVIARPRSTLPFASRGVAVNCSLCPDWILAEPGVTVTDATGALTFVTV